MGQAGVRGGGCKTDMQSALLGEVADKRGPLQGGEEGLRVASHLHSPIKFLYFRDIRRETEQSEKRQSGDTWYNKQYWNKDRRIGSGEDEQQVITQILTVTGAPTCHDMNLHPTLSQHNMRNTRHTHLKDVTEGFVLGLDAPARRGESSSGSPAWFILRDGQQRAPQLQGEA